MLRLRVVRGSRPLALLRGALLATVSGGAGFLLLSALGQALARPGGTDGAVTRLLWCMVPVAAVAALASALARLRLDPGLMDAVAEIGHGRRRLSRPVVGATALECALGSALALVTFLCLRGDAARWPLAGGILGHGPLGADDAAALGAGSPLPTAGTLTLLAVVPAFGAAASALAVRPARWAVPWGNAADDGEPLDAPHRWRLPWTGRATGAARTEHAQTEHAWTEPAPSAQATTAQAPTGQAPTGRARTVQAPWAGRAAWMAQAAAGRAPTPGAWTGRAARGGAVLVVAGLLVELGDAVLPAGGGVGLADGLVPVPAVALVGWVLAVTGLALNGPRLVRTCGRALLCARPGATRLLAGRGLEAEAARLGRAAGLLCAAVCAAVAWVRLCRASPGPGPGALTALGVGLVALCVLVTVAAIGVESHRAGAATRATLARLGAPSSLPRRAGLLRGGALLFAVGVLGWTVGEAAALPLRW